MLDQTVQISIFTGCIGPSDSGDRWVVPFGYQTQEEGRGTAQETRPKRQASLARGARAGPRSLQLHAERQPRNNQGPAFRSQWSK